LIESKTTLTERNIAKLDRIKQLEREVKDVKRASNSKTVKLEDTISRMEENLRHIQRERVGLLKDRGPELPPDDILRAKFDEFGGRCQSWAKTHARPSIEDWSGKRPQITNMLGPKN
jgi:hypothetical protein